MGTVNAVAVKEANTVAPISEEMAAWGASKEVSSNDLIIPQILTMQSTSELVQNDKAVMGEFRDSLTGKLIGKSGSSPFEVIPFHCQEVWVINAQEADGNYAYHSTEPIVKSPMNPKYNDNLPWEDKMLIEGTMTPIKRVRRYNFFVLLKSELESGDVVMPYFIGFKSTSVKEGKKLFNMMYVRNTAAGLTPASYSFKIDGRREKNEKGTFVVPTVEQAGKTSEAHLQKAFYWFKKINGTAVKLHEDEAAPQAADSSSTGDF